MNYDEIPLYISISEYNNLVILGKKLQKSIKLKGEGDDYIAWV